MRKKVEKPQRDAKGHFLKGHHMGSPPGKRGKSGKQKNPSKTYDGTANLNKFGELKLDEEMIAILEQAAAPNNETPAELFVGALKRGLPIDLACERMGISRVTWSDWIRRAEAGEKIPFLDRFLVLARMVRAEHYAYHLNNIKEQASGTGEHKGWWQGSAWYLERLEQDRFALRHKKEVEVNVNIRTIIQEAEEAALAYAKLVNDQPPLDVEYTEVPQLEAPDTPSTHNK